MVDKFKALVDYSAIVLSPLADYTAMCPPQFISMINYKINQITNLTYVMRMLGWLADRKLIFLLILYKLKINKKNKEYQLSYLVLCNQK
jgi:hypothetical protein